MLLHQPGGKRIEQFRLDVDCLMQHVIDRLNDSDAIKVLQTRLAMFRAETGVVGEVSHLQPPAAVLGR